MNRQHTLARAIKYCEYIANRDHEGDMKEQSVEAYRETIRAMKQAADEAKRLILFYLGETECRTENDKISFGYVEPHPSKT